MKLSLELEGVPACPAGARPHSSHLLLHYSIDWQNSWFTERRKTYCDHEYPSHVRGAANRNDTLDGWWSDASRRLNALAPRQAERRLELAVLLRESAEPVITVLLDKLPAGSAGPHHRRSRRRDTAGGAAVSLLSGCRDLDIVAQSSIVHRDDYSMGTATIYSLFRREDIISADANRLRVPVLSGNNFRGILRRAWEGLTAEVVDYEKSLPVPAAHLHHRRPVRRRLPIGRGTPCAA